MPWIFIAWLLFGQTALAQYRYLEQVWSPYFKHYTADDGLSQSLATKIVQDNAGFLWLKTPVGIDRFNGFEFEPIEFISDKEPHPQDSIVSLLHSDTGQIIAVSTMGGVYQYSETKHAFELQFFPTNPALIEDAALVNQQLYLFSNIGVYVKQLPLLSRSGVNHLHPTLSKVKAVSHVSHDEFGNLWIGNFIGELYHFNTHDNRLTQVNIPIPANKKQRQEVIPLSDKKGGVYVGLDTGDIFYVSANDLSITLVYENQGQFSKATSIIQSSDNYLWIGTQGHGLIRLNLKTLKIEQFKIITGQRGSLSSNNIYSLFIDTQGQLWASAPNGINVALVENVRFYQIGGNQAYSAPLATSSAYNIAIDQQNKLWISSHDAGLSILTPADTIQSTSELIGAQQILSNNKNFYLSNLPTPRFITSIDIDSKNRVWVGSSSGLQWIDATNGQSLTVDSQWQDASNRGISNIYISNNDVLIFTQDNRFYYQKNNQPIHDFQVTDSKKKFDGFDVVGPINNTYWFSSSQTGKIFEYHTQTNRLSSFKIKNKLNQFVDSINTITLAKDGSLWVGTSSNGVGHRAIGEQSFKWWDKTDGLADNYVYSILVDKNNYVWVAGNKGLSRISPQDQSINVFTSKDGLQSNEFNGRARLASKAGVLFFSGINGVTAIDSNTFKTSSFSPTPYIQSAKLLTDTQQRWLEISQGKVEPLNYWDNSINFKIGAIDLLNPEGIQFAYQLSGHENSWVDLENSRNINLLDLPAGDYLLKVRACNAEAACNATPAETRFSIPAPPWRTIWAYLIYILVASALLIRFLVKQRNKLIQQQKAAAQERKIANELRELHTLKDEFLANTSHELRTPLNGVIGLSETLIIDPLFEQSNEAKESLEAIYNCGKQLKTLVDDLLDFSQLQNKRLMLKPEAFNISHLIEQVILLLQPQASIKNQKLEHVAEIKDITVFADQNRIRQVLYNLINNAIKFSDKGVIKIKVSLHENAVNIAVIDKGIGIPAEMHQKIFLSFTQIDGTSTRNQGGVGLGLAICKDIVELHGSRLNLRSTLGQGSSFSFTLPLAHKT
ncbi:ATP-binding protein [Aliikangiella sp. IMCC44632]